MSHYTLVCIDELLVQLSTLELGRCTVSSIQLSTFDLTDLHHLHAQQLDLGSTVLQHLLGSREHLPVLEDTHHNMTT